MGGIEYELKQGEPGNRRRTRSLLVWPGLLALTIIIAGAGPAAPAVPDQMALIPHFDKIVHFFVFGLLGTLVLRAFYRGTRSAFPILLALAVTSAFGLADEVHQSTNPVRQFAWSDWAADAAGGVVAVTAYLGWRRYREILEFDLRRAQKNGILQSTPRETAGVSGDLSAEAKRR